MLKAKQLKKSSDFFERVGFKTDNHQNYIGWTKECEYFIISIQAYFFEDGVALFNVYEHDFMHDSQSDPFLLTNLLKGSSLDQVADLLNNITNLRKTDIKDRATIILNTYNHLVSIEKPNKALVFLFDHINKMLPDLYSCQKFLEKIEVDKQSTDFLVHVLNALSPVKEKIENWDKFYRQCHQFFIVKKGEEIATSLMKVAM